MTAPDGEVWNDDLQEFEVVKGRVPGQHGGVEGLTERRRGGVGEWQR
jgi:hypothetical protein